MRLEQKRGLLFAACLNLLPWVLLPFSFLNYSIIPLERDTIPGIITAPFFHEDFNHLFYNIIFLLPFSVTICLLERKAPIILSVIFIFTGVFTWYFGKPGYHFGMSGVAIGYSFFIIGSSLFTMEKTYVIPAIITVLTQFALLLNIFDSQLGISDDAHISGAFAGGVTAFFTQRPWKKRS